MTRARLRTAARTAGGLALLAATAASALVPSPPRTGTDAALLMAVRSGEVLAAQHPDRRHPPASLAKLMTAYVTFRALERDRIDPGDRVRISERAWRLEGSQMFLEVGERVPVRKLLAGMIVASGNDAARALAGYVGGSVDAFVARMNRQAARLGLSRTHFANPSGMPAPGMHTTARDMARLSAELWRRFPRRYALFARTELSHNGITQTNRNRILSYFRGADGLKTGYSEGAGYNLAASAARGDMRLISVVLGADSPDRRFQASQALLTYGFRFYDTLRLYAAGTPVHRVRVWKGQRERVPLVLAEPLHLTYPAGRRDSLTVKAELATPVTAPLAAGERLGSLRVGLGDRVLAHRPLVSGAKVARAGWLELLADEARLGWRSFWREQRRSLLAEDRSGAEPAG